MALSPPARHDRRLVHYGGGAWLDVAARVASCRVTHGDARARFARRPRVVRDAPTTVAAGHALRTVRLPSERRETLLATSAPFAVHGAGRPFALRRNASPDVAGDALFVTRCTRSPGWRDNSALRPRSFGIAPCTVRSTRRIVDALFAA